MLDWEGKKPVVVVDAEELAMRGKAAVEEAWAKKREGKQEWPPKGMTVEEYEAKMEEEVTLDLSEMCAMEVMKLLREGEVTPERLVEVWAYRRSQVDASVRSTPVEYSAQARDYAKRKAVSWEDQHDAHLLGMPVLIKGVTAVKGFPRFDGYYAPAKGPVASRSSWIVAQIQQLGGIVAGMTNVPEFAAGGHCFNGVYDTTANPYDLRRSAGGSSGGSAAALASRQIWLALGTDLGGSLRTPAAFCGVCGFRVTPGIIPRGDPPAPEKKKTPRDERDDEMDDDDDDEKDEARQEQQQQQKLVRRYDLHSIEGPMARCIWDIAVLMDALTYPLLGGAPPGWDGLYPGGHVPYAIPLDKPSTWVDVAEHGFFHRVRTKVGITRLGCDVRDDVFDLIYQAARHVAEDDFDLIDEPWPLDVAERVFYALRAKNFKANYADAFPADSLKPEITWNVASSSQVDVDKAFHDNEHVIAPAVLELFETIDVLCAPVTIDLPFAKELRYPTARYGKSAAAAAGETPEELKDYMHWLKPTYLVSVTECPALVMPVGALEDGLPVGIQLIAKPGNDAYLVEIAASLEGALDLDFKHGIETPRTGKAPLTAIGPRTADEAREHHDRRPPLE
mmetsp:Transcript_32605/g.103971  ORF Transcript_32605/g.103971 Transcript_32605/m.103971 type:complete len:619 (+) Transcript_32605:129-1985(+)